MCKNYAKHIVYITNTKFQHSNMPIYKTLENSRTLNILRKNLFSYNQRENISFDI